jgi:hypothetical protein
MNERGEIDWRRVKETHDQWKYSHSGMGPALMMVIAIAISVMAGPALSAALGELASAGVGTAMAAAVPATAATATTAAVSATAAGWANMALTAALTSATANASINLINTRGKLDDTLKNTFSSDSIKSYAVAAASAGARSYVNGSNLYNGAASTAVANGMIGGTSASIMGDSFQKGFLIAAGTSLAKQGWEAARADTDADSLKGLGEHKYNKWGELLTDGIRVTVYPEGSGYNGENNNNFFTSSGMAPEGSGEHWYNENSFIGRAVNAVSKVHDFQNKWGYVNGNYLSQSEAYNTLFQAYSISGMLPAAIFTGIAFIDGYVPVYLPSLKKEGKNANK